MQDFRQAEFWKRGMAFLLDVLLIYAQAIILTVLVHVVCHRPLPPPDALKPLDVIIALAVFLGSGWLYFAVTESYPKQASLGKRALGIMVIDLTGDRISLSRAARRFGLKIFSLLFLLIPFSHQKISYDSWSNTLVVNK